MTIDSKSFQNLSLSPELLTVLEELEFKQMTPIQEQALPVVLSGKDLIGESPTGSGKTLAFSLLILQKIKISSRFVQAIVLCPTRELADQVVRDLRKWGRRLNGFQVAQLTGGQPMRAQRESLEQGAHVIVATPGRLLDLLDRGYAQVKQVEIVVLDEADKMLEMGFEEQIKFIMDDVPRDRQTMLFSATFPDSIQKLSKRYQKNPQHIQIAASEESKPDIEQIMYSCKNEDKINILMRVLQQHPSDSTVIFCNEKVKVAEIGEVLAKNKVSSAALHGDLEQRDRERVLSLFRNGSYRILVATDVAGRGLDIENLDLVINFDLPAQAQIYVHRIGRTGRAGRKGTAVSLVGLTEPLKIGEFEQYTGQRIELKTLGFKNQHGLGYSYQVSAMQTLSISGGRKDKLRPGDILGALTADPGGLKGAEIGQIELSDHNCYVAVSSAVVNQALEKLRTGKIKGKKFQVKLVK